MPLRALIVAAMPDAYFSPLRDVSLYLMLMIRFIFAIHAFAADVTPMIITPLIRRFRHFAAAIHMPRCRAAVFFSLRRYAAYMLPPPLFLIAACLIRRCRYARLRFSPRRRRHARCRYYFD